MSIVYELLVENKIRNNLKTVKRMYNSLLRESKQDLALFKTEFQTLNESTNVDDSDLRRSFKHMAECLKESKDIITKAESTSYLMEKHSLVKEAYNTIKDGVSLRESLMEDFSNVVKHAESVHRSLNEGEERPYICVHAKKGKHECKASSSYEAAKKAAAHWKLKNTSGIDAHLADVKHTATT